MIATANLGLIAIFAPLVVALLLAVSGPIRRTGVGAAALSLLAAVGNLGAAGVLAARWWGRGDLVEIAEWSWLVALGDTMATVGVHVDGVSAAMLAVVSVVALCVQIFSLSYLSDEPMADLGRYYMWQSLFLFSMNALVLAPNLLQLFMAWELVGVCSYLLIGYWYTKPSAAKAAVKAFWMTKMADMGLMLGLIIQYKVTGGFGFDETDAVALGSAVGVVTFCYFIAVMGKSAQFPLHVWLPDAMEGPTPVSALLHAATMVAAGVYLIVRGWPLFELAEDTRMFMAVIGGTTALFSATVAVVQTDIKKVLAYSTSSQLGYMVAALGAGDMIAGYYHLTTHAFFKALLFLAAGSVIHAVHSNELSKMGGLLKKMPVTGGTFIVGTLALSGFPLTAGFFSKDMVLEALLHGAQHGHSVLWIPLVFCLIAAGLTAYYMFRVVFTVFFGEPSEAAGHAHEGDLALLVPLVLLAVMSFMAGYPMVFGLTAQWGHEAHVGVTPIGAAATLMMLLGIGVAAQLHYRRRPVPGIDALAPLGDLARSGAIDAAWANGYRHGLKTLGAGVAWFDRYVIDGVVNLVGVWALLGAGRMRTIQTGRAGDYVYAVVLGVIVVAAWTAVVGA